MEFVDVVNENDEVTGTAPKEETHDRGLLHRTVIAEVKDSLGRWLLVKQANDKQDAGQFVSPVGGHVTAGEDVEDALKREAMEELGIECKEYQLVGKVIFNRKTRGKRENHYFIVYEIFSEEKPTLNEESIEYRYFTEEELGNEIKDNPKLFGDAFHFVLKSLYPHLIDFA